MKPFRRCLVISSMACLATAPLVAQQYVPPPRPDEYLLAQDAQERTKEAQERAQEALERSREALERTRESLERLNDYYRQGARALDDRRYEKAIERFDKVIERKADRADGAMYWKAYALNKLGKQAEALATLSALEKSFAGSRWLNDAKALQVEVQQASGQAVSPESQTDEDLKLLAINSLMNSDPDRAVPLLQKVINDPKNTPKLKERALFVLAQSRSPKARDLVVQYAKGGSNPDVQLKAVEYLGTFGSRESRQVLADVYSAVSDVAVKRAILRSYMIGQDKDHLLAVAKSDPNADLRREAIRWLGVVHAQNELSQLYSAESSPDVKEEIIQAMFIGGNADKLIEIAKSEKDVRLRQVAIRRLGAMRRDNTADALVQIYNSDSDKTSKKDVIRSLFIQNAAHQLVEIVRNEKDPELKRDGVQKLSLMKNKEATDFLMELLNK